MSKFPLGVHDEERNEKCQRTDKTLWIYLRCTQYIVCATCAQYVHRKRLHILAHRTAMTRAFDFSDACTKGKFGFLTKCIEASYAFPSPHFAFFTMCSWLGLGMTRNHRRENMKIRQKIGRTLLRIQHQYQCFINWKLSPTAGHCQICWRLIPPNFPTIQ